MQNIFRSSRLIGLIYSKKYINFIQENWLNKISDLFLIFFIFSVTLSPDISKIFRSVNFPAAVYVSDILVLLLLIIFLIKLFQGQIVLRDSGLDIPIFIYLCFAIISTIRGVIVGTINMPVIALFTFLRQLEYVFIFYFVLNHIKTKRQVIFFLIVWLISATMVSIYGIYEHFYPQVFTRELYRIYERGWFTGQVNHFAGYLLVFICIAFAIFIFTKRNFLKITLVSALFFMMLAFLWTYSRQAYLAILLSLGIVLFLKSKRLFMVFLVLLIFLLFIVPSQQTLRLNSLIEAFQSSNTHHSTIAARLYNWKIALSSVPSHLFLGVGLGARHRAYYDNQYIQLLSELGFIGLFCFVYLLVLIVKKSYLVFRAEENGLFKGISLGFLAGFIGIAAQGMASMTFLVTRIAWPISFLLAMVIVMEPKNA